MSFCALCTHDIPSGRERRAPLGKGDALVTVCAECDLEPAREIRGPEYEYAPQSFGGIRHAVAKAARELPARRFFAVARDNGNRTPGRKIVRVGRKHPKTGAPLDNREAYAEAKRRHGRGLVGIGVDERFYLFEKPDVNAKSLADDGEDWNDPIRAPLTAIEKYRRTTKPQETP